MAKVRDWPESMKDDCFLRGLNAERVAKALDHDDPPTLVSWIQLAAEVESHQHLMKLICQNQQPAGKKAESHPKKEAKRHGRNQVRSAFLPRVLPPLRGIGEFWSKVPISLSKPPWDQVPPRKLLG